MAKFILFFIIIPTWLFSQSEVYLSSNPLDELVYDGISHLDNQYFITYTGDYESGILAYNTHLIKMNSSLEILGTLSFNNIGPYKLFPMKTLISNDTMFVFGDAIHELYEDRRIFLSKISLDLTWKVDRLVGDEIHIERATDAIINQNGKFIIAGNTIIGEEHHNLLLYELSRDGIIIKRTVDTNFLPIKPTLIEISSKNIYHILDIGKVSIYNYDFINDTILRPEFYNRFVFDYELSYYNNSSYFVGGRTYQYYKNESTVIERPSNDDTFEISYFLVDNQILPTDSGFIPIPDYDDYCGGICFTSSNNLIIGGIKNFSVGMPPFFEEDLRWIIVQCLDFETNDTDWNFEYGGDANYFMKGLYSTDDNGAIIYAEKYDWQNTENLQRDILILKIDSTGVLVGTNEKKLHEEIEITIFPNPGTQYINVISDSSHEGRIFILFDLAGKKLLEVLLDQKNNRISVNSLQSGTYIYKVRSSKDNEIQSGIWIKK